jgi:hypothetical protein
MAIAVRLDPPRLSAPAGSDVDGVVAVANPLDEVVHVHIVVSGEVAGWATVEPGEVWLQPGETVECELRFRLPRGAPGGVGEVPFTVRVLSDVEGVGGAVAAGSLSVEGQAELALRLVPGTAKGTLHATAKVAADNLGDVPARAQLVAEAAAAGVAVEVVPDSVIIEPGETAWARVTLRPERRFVLGAPRRHPYWVRLEPLGGARVSVEGQLVQRSLVSGFLPVVVLGLVAAVVAGLVLAGVIGGGDGSDLAANGTLPTTIPTTTTVAPTTTAAPVAAGQPAPTSTTVPLNQRRIAFQSKRDGNFEIYTAKPDGTEVVNVTNSPSHEGEPAWSPDGTRLAFDSDRAGGFDVWVMNADGTNPVQLTTEPTPDGYPAWSPDGTRLAFISLRDGNSEIYVMNADGTGQTRLTKNLNDDGHPSWSPDGTHLAFHTDRDGNYEVYVMGVDGSSPQNLSNNPAFDQDPEWAPNGVRIAFDSTRDGTKDELYLMGADGSLPTRLTNNDWVDKWPEWSPDGTKVAYQSDQFDDLEVFVVGVGGGQPKRYTDSPGDDGEPTW